MDLAIIKQLCSENKIKWTVHCAQRLIERGISRKDVLKCLCQGEKLEDYPNSFPLPSCLVFGHTIAGKILHVVVGTDRDFLFIITAYFPDETKFEKDMKMRRN